MIERRDFLKLSAIVGTATLSGFGFRGPTRMDKVRDFSLCTNPVVLNKNPELFEIIVKSGVDQVWMPVFLNGYYPYPNEDILFWKKKFETNGLIVHSLTVPLGHPNSSLGQDNSFDTPPQTWPRSVDVNGNKYSGTSVHPMVTEENKSVIQKIGKLGFKKLFLDDDFRLARSPGAIGGCFCNEHQLEFLNKYGYGPNLWSGLKQDIANRRLSPVLRDWINFNCDQLTGSFRAQQAAAPDVKLGIMVMYLGSEKAGIRLSDYKGSMMRVGELMFEDKSFNPVKGKTDELFSVLFHRRYVSPELAYSETTAYPPTKLSAKNMAAKLHITTMADIRHTMMMSGLDPFPLTHWETLAPAMKKAAAMHRKIAGQTPRGPFKHYWGESSRMVGTDKPYSLFLAAGVPFEVTDTPAADGWTFLSEFDAEDVAANKLKSNGTRFIYGPKENKNIQQLQYTAESLEELFKFKRQILGELENVPYVVEDKPVVCCWYPKINTVMLWNLAESKESFSVKMGNKIKTIDIEGLDAELMIIKN